MSNKVHEAAAASGESKTEQNASAGSPTSETAAEQDSQKAMQWFRGELEGHYVGLDVGRPGVSDHGIATRYKMRIYRAVIRKVEEISEEEASETGSKVETFYQGEIEEARLLGVRPRRCFEGKVYDLSLNDFQVTHATAKATKTYGRIEGQVYGRYLLPESIEKEAPIALRELHDEVQIETPVDLPLADEKNSASQDQPQIETLHPLRAEREDLQRELSDVPIPFMVFLVAIVLGLGGGWEPALLWVASFVPVLAIRFMLSGMFKVSAGQRIVGALVFAAQLACLAWLFSDWWSTGCIALIPGAMAGIAGSLLVASLLPSPLPLLCTGAGLGLVLFLWYGDIGPHCDEGPESNRKPNSKSRMEEVKGMKPQGHQPQPRTNSDGSWPRRPPG